MLDASHPIVKFAREDGRYHVDAYAFVFDALAYAHNVLGLGGGALPDAGEAPTEEEDLPADRHLTGQELCEAIRSHAQDQYGFLAKSVLNSWGVHATGDFGEIVFNLIKIGQMRKNETDRREDFNNVFDFDQDLVQGYRIKLTE